ncbi:hypothetical protein THAOC_24923, partial [Thalassiosira oceanica]
DFPAEMGTEAKPKREETNVHEGIASSVDGVDRRLNSLHRSKFNDLSNRGGLALRSGEATEIERRF